MIFLTNNLKNIEILKKGEQSKRNCLSKSMLKYEINLINIKQMVKQ